MGSVSFAPGMVQRNLHTVANDTAHCVLYSPRLGCAA